VRRGGESSLFRSVGDLRSLLLSSCRTAGSDYRVPVLWWRDTRPEVAVRCLDVGRPRLRSVRSGGHQRDLLRAKGPASQRKRTVVMALAAPALGLQRLYTLSGSPIVADLLALTVAAFYAFTVANVLGYVLGPGASHRRQAARGRRRLSDCAAVEPSTRWSIISSRAPSASTGSAISLRLWAGRSCCFSASPRFPPRVTAGSVPILGMPVPGDSPAPRGDRHGAQVEPRVSPGPSAKDAPSAGFCAWRPDWRRMTPAATIQDRRRTRGALFPRTVRVRSSSLKGRGISLCPIQRPPASRVGRSQHSR
jgi:hypothetical protein